MPINDSVYQARRLSENDSVYQAHVMMIPIPLASVSLFGERFMRPECVLATRGGHLYASDARGGVYHRDPAGRRRVFAGASLDLSGPLHPNGIALNRDGSFVVAHLGSDTGGVYRLDRAGGLAPILQHIDGKDLTATNFVLVDRDERLWVTISTRHRPRMSAFRPDVADGYIILIDGAGARIVADGIGFANELRVDHERKLLYIVETYAKRLSRFRVGEDGSLSGRETVAEFEAGEFPDGLALDSEGGVWVTCIVANRIIRIGPDGGRMVMLDDCDKAYCDEVETAYRAGRMEKAHIDRTASTTLGNVSSLAFAGPDLRTVYCGVLLRDKLPCFTSPIPGAPMAHWGW